ncbi:MAG: glycosyltransferase [Spirochaeta sp.]|nr:glycosyltransferase [Spirochaeta sp.]
MKASVIIPTYNEETHLPPLLEDLANQRFRDFEVIVADAASTDRTRELAAEAGATVVDGGMPAVGRNAGAARASGEILVFLDSDVRIPESFLTNAIIEMEERNLVAATAEARPLSDLAMDRVIHRFANLFIRLNQENEPHAPGYCILARRDVVTAIGGFNEEIQVAEDHDFVTRASEHGPFRMLNTAWFHVSVRRYEKEGRIAYSMKAARVTLYRAVHGEITDDSVFDYDFGDFEAEDKTEVQKALRRMEKGVNRLDRRLQKLERKMEKALRRGTWFARWYQRKLNRSRQKVRDAMQSTFGGDL